MPRPARSLVVALYTTSANLRLGRRERAAAEGAGVLRTLTAPKVRTSLACLRVSVVDASPMQAFCAEDTSSPRTNRHASLRNC